MRWLLVMLFLVIPAGANAQGPSPQVQMQYVRLSLNDGRFVDGYITGSDAANYFVQTSYGYFSILRANVLQVTPMAQPQPQYQPPPQYPPTQYAPPQYAPPPAAPRAEEGSSGDAALGRVAGIFYFGITYGITVMAASSKVDEDDTAKAGYIPVAGPCMWAFADDEDDVGEDGWDWLAVGTTLIQASGVYMIITGDTGGKSNKVKVSAISTKGYSGLLVGGRF